MDTARRVHKLLNPGDLPAPVKLEKFSRKNLAKLFGTLGFNRGVEVGVERGKYSQVLCNNNPDLHLICVDPWVEYPGYIRAVSAEKFGWQKQEAVKRLAPYNVDIWEQFSMDAVRNVAMNSLDFVYIDGNHAFDWVMQDIIEWSKRVRPGGIVSGHDYYRFRGAGVVDAVNAYVYAHGIKEWFLTNESKAKSFFWVKR